MGRLTVCLHCLLCCLRHHLFHQHYHLLLQAPLHAVQMTADMQQMTIAMMEGRAASTVTAALELTALIVASAAHRHAALTHASTHRTEIVMMAGRAASTAAAASRRTAQTVAQAAAALHRQQHPHPWYLSVSCMFLVYAGRADRQAWCLNSVDSLLLVPPTFTGAAAALKSTSTTIHTVMEKQVRLHAGYSIHQFQIYSPHLI